MDLLSTGMELADVWQANRCHISIPFMLQLCGCELQPGCIVRYLPQRRKESRFIVVAQSI